MARTGRRQPGETSLDRSELLAVPRSTATTRYLRQIRDPILRRRVAREKCVDILAVFLLLPPEHLEQLDHAFPAPARLSQYRHSHTIGLTFLVAIELQEHAAGQQTCGGLRRAGAANVSKERTQQAKAPLRDHPLRKPVGAVSLGDVRDLVSQHSGHL